MRIDALQLEAADGLVVVETGELLCLFISLAHCSSRNHLTDVEATPEPTTESAKRRVRNAGHRGKHNGRLQVDGANLHPDSLPLDSGERDHRPAKAAERSTGFRDDLQPIGQPTARQE